MRTIEGPDQNPQEKYIKVGKRRGACKEYWKGTARKIGDTELSIRKEQSKAALKLSEIKTSSMHCI